MTALSKSHWPADTSVPVLETTVGGVLRAAAVAGPDRLAMVGGLKDADRRVALPIAAQDRVPFQFWASEHDFANEAQSGVPRRQWFLLRRVTLRACSHSFWI